MEGCQQTQQPVVLRTWQMESPHNYENSRHETTVFVCPGATSFEVEFDERCETEKRCEELILQLYCHLLVKSWIILTLFLLQIHMVWVQVCIIFTLIRCGDFLGGRYDYLEFTDARGGKVRYDMKVGTEKWPKVQKLLYYFKYSCLPNVFIL